LTGGGQQKDTAWHQQGDSQQHLQTAGADAVVGQRYNAVMSRPMVYTLCLNKKHVTTFFAIT